MYSPRKPLAMWEFVSLLAFMISILALSIDAMLPALTNIASDLELENPNDAQLVISSMFLGFAIGQIVAGPLSDCYGRKPVIYCGYAIFIFGCLISAITSDFAVLLAGRVLQGLGAAAPRIVGIALVRDGYEGRAMARIMSIVMAIFILVPAIAPAIGQGILLLADWRMIFVMLFVVSILALIWFALRQPETLPLTHRRTFTLLAVAQGIGEALSYRMLTGYMICSGLIFGAFLGYLSIAPQIFLQTYKTNDMFVIYFGVAALTTGIASLVNSRLVLKLGMRFLSFNALIVLGVCSVLFFIFALYHDGVPPFLSFMIWLFVSTFCVGMLFGNFNALAMEPVGHMAGLGAAVNGAFSTFISLPFGWAIGAAYDGSILTLVGGFAALSVMAMATMKWTENGSSDRWY